MPTSARQTEPISSSAGLEFKLLGRFSLTRDGRPLDGFAYDKVRCLLAYLVVESGTPHSREHLAELLWPGADGETARGNLRHALFSLKKALGPEGDRLLHTSRQTVAFDGDFAAETDFHRFYRPAKETIRQDPQAVIRLETRLALYQGTLLEGLEMAGAPGFELWLSQRREQTLTHALGVLQELADHYETLGHLERAIVYLRRHGELAPWQEAPRRHLIRLLIDLNKPGEALKEFETCRLYLTREMGVEPDLSTQALIEPLRAKASQPRTGRKQPAHQRLPVTVLAGQIVLDQPANEDSPGRLAALRQICADEANRRGGHFVFLLGHQFFVYFGYPSAQENAPRQALEAALAMVERLSGGTSQLKLGLHHDWMLADTSLPSPDALGLVSQPALDLAQQCRGSGILASAPVCLATEGFFHFGPAETGGARPVIGRTGALNRLSAAPRLTPLVGRRDEIHRLLSHWTATTRHAASAALVWAEPGIGKSRLVQAIAHQVRSGGHGVIELHCPADQRHTPYAALVDYLEHRFAGAPGSADTPDLQGDRLAQRLEEESPALRDHLPVIASLLRLPSALDQIADIPQRQAQLRAGIQALLEAMTRPGPTLLVVEDLHWADASLLEALSRFHQPLEGREKAPTMLLLTSRHAHCPFPTDLIPLHPMPPELALELARQVVGPGGGAVPAALDSIVARADGVPLYIEQMVCRLHDTPGGDIPPTLRDLLVARLDSLGEFRPLAGLAAVIGRSFDADLLAALAAAAGERGLDVDAGLARMSRGLLIEPESGRRYVFRHALILEAAYLSLPTRQRRGLHLHLVEVLRKHFSLWLTERPELLAHHLDAAADPGAASAWLEAGRYTADRSAQGEALEMFRAGLAALARIPDPSQQEAVEFRLQVALGNALIALQGYGSQSAQQAYQRAWELSDRINDDHEVFTAMWGLWLGGRSVNGDTPPLAFAERLAQMAQGSSNPTVHLQLHYAFGNNYFWIGRHDLSRRHLEAGLDLLPRVDRAKAIAQYGEDGGVTCLSFLSWVQWIQGQADDARQTSAAAVAAARASGHAHTLGYALTFAAKLYRDLGLPGEVQALAGELMGLAEANGLRLWQAAAAVHLGWVAALNGDAAGLAPIHAGVAGARLAMPIVETTFLSFLVDALCRLERLEEAETTVDEAIQIAQRQSDVYFMPEFLRWKGEILRLRHGNGAAARVFFERSRDLAETQGALALVLRAEMSLAQLNAQTGCSEEAKAHLQACCQRFRQGADLPDQQAARYLLSQWPA